MPTRSDIPFNIQILRLDAARLYALKPVRALDIFDGTSSNFHEDGFFSASIFGKVGDPRRQTRFSYLDIKVTVFHPVVYRAFVALKRLYAGILAGTEYAIWNDEIKDFERSDAMNGRTGFAFFVQYWKSIEYAETKSDGRQQNILLIKKYQEDAMTNKVIVMPAGLRDIEVGEDGRAREDEINGIYRQILAVSNTVSESTATSSPEIINTARYSLQMKFNEIYDTIERMIEGKKKLLMGKWASRTIMHGTRNVITAMDTSVAYLGAPGTVKFNNTIIGLYQMSKAILPVSCYFLRTGFLSHVFRGVDIPSILVNKKTLKREEVLLKPRYFERWMTDEGLEKVLTSFSEESLRDKPIEIDGRYLGLIYKGPDKTFRFMQDIGELPEGRLPEHVTPVTFCELIYLSGYRKWNDYPILMTRYPITGVGSIYPSMAYVKTTTKAEQRQELSGLWEPMGPEYIAYEFPTKGPYINSVIPHSAKLDKAAADFDGDMMSTDALMTEESKDEAREFFKTKRAYVGTDGNFISSTAVHTVELVLHNLTGD